MNIILSIRTEQVHDHFCCLVQFIVSLVVCNFFHHDDVLLIYRSDKVLGFATEDSSDLFHFIAIFLSVRLNDKYHSPDFCINMELLRSVININQQ